MYIYIPKKGTLTFRLLLRWCAVRYYMLFTVPMIHLQYQICVYMWRTEVQGCCKTAKKGEADPYLASQTHLVCHLVLPQKLYSISTRRQLSVAAQMKAVAYIVTCIFQYFYSWSIHVFINACIYIYVQILSNIFRYACVYIYT